jgi:hypothetical protein
MLMGWDFAFVFLFFICHSLSSWQLFQQVEQESENYDFKGSRGFYVIN